MFTVFIMPLLSFFLGIMLSSYLLWLCGFICYLFLMVSWVPTLHYYRVSRLISVTLPVIAILFMLMTLHSFMRYRLGFGLYWKGRTYCGNISGSTSE